MQSAAQRTRIAYMYSLRSNNTNSIIALNYRSFVFIHAFESKSPSILTKIISGPNISWTTKDIKVKLSILKGNIIYNDYLLYFDINLRASLHLLFALLHISLYCSWVGWHLLHRRCVYKHNYMIGKLCFLYNVCWLWCQFTNLSLYVLSHIMYFII